MSKEVSSAVDVYIENVLMWRKYILRYHKDGIWDDLYKKAKSILPKLVAFKLAYSGMTTDGYLFDLGGLVANKFGLPNVGIPIEDIYFDYELDDEHTSIIANNIRSTTLKQLRCPRNIFEQINNDIEKRKKFHYGYAKYFRYTIHVAGSKRGNTYKAWVMLKDSPTATERLYYLLDGNHAIRTLDYTDIDYEIMEYMAKKSNEILYEI